MRDTSIVLIAPADTSSSGVAGLIASGVLAASGVYIAATTMLLPRIPDASAAIDVFLASVLPCLMVIMLLWAARPTEFPRHRRRALVAATLLVAAAISAIPTLFSAA